MTSTHDQPSGQTRARTRETTIDDPQEMGRLARELPGIDFLRAVIEQQFRVPIGATLDFRLSEVEPGRCLFIAEPSEFMFNAIGTLHGGYYAAVLDAALGVAVHSELPQGVGYTTLELKVNIVRPYTLGAGPLRVEGRVLHSGRRTAVSEASVLDRNGKLYAHATSTCLIIGPV
ncbi:MAG: PaaI family thioesterase [Myxococcales bacterium]|nr:PaaI family thioesterase [Myxococcales bacterium]